MKRFFLAIFLGLQVTYLVAQSTDNLNMYLDISGTDLAVEVEYLARPEQASDSLFFILNPAYQLDTIAAPFLREYHMGQRPDRPFPGQVLYFERAFGEGSEIPVTFRYTMDLSASNHWDSGWLELNVDKLWFPIRGDLGNDITFEVILTGFPDDWDLVSHMDASVEKKEDTIGIVQTNPAHEVLILAGEGMEHLQLSDSIEFFAGKQVPDTVIDSMHEKVHRSIDFLNETVGKGEQIGEFRVVLRNTDRSEIGFQFNRKNMIVTGPDFDSYGNLSHEIAHYWWSGADFIEEPWMNESFANYFMFLVQEQFDPEGYSKTLKNFRKRAEKAPAVLGATAFEKDGYAAYYHKGAVLLKDLENQVGKDQMIQALRTCIAQDIHTTEGFIGVLGEAFGTQVPTDFRESLLE